MDALDWWDFASALSGKGWACLHCERDSCISRSTAMLLLLFYQVRMWVEGWVQMQKRQRCGLCLTVLNPTLTLRRTFLRRHTMFFRLTHHLASYWALSAEALAGDWKTAEGRRLFVSLDFWQCPQSRGSDVVTANEGPGLLVRHLASHSRGGLWASWEQGLRLMAPL